MKLPDATDAYAKCYATTKEENYSDVLHERKCFLKSVGFTAVFHLSLKKGCVKTWVSYFLLNIIP